MNDLPQPLSQQVTLIPYDAHAPFPDSVFTVESIFGGDCRVRAVFRPLSPITMQNTFPTAEVQLDGDAKGLIRPGIFWHLRLVSGVHQIQLFNPREPFWNRAAVNIDWEVMMSVEYFSAEGFKKFDNDAWNYAEYSCVSRFRLVGPDLMPTKKEGDE